MQEVGRTSRELARAALEHARVSRLVYPRGGSDGFEGWEPAELQVLLAVLLTPGRTVSELGDDEALGLARTTVSNAVAKLMSAEPEALLEADPDPKDARSQSLHVTAAGIELAEAFLAHARPHLRTH